MPVRTTATPPEPAAVGDAAQQDVAGGTMRAGVAALVEPQRARAAERQMRALGRDPDPRSERARSRRGAPSAVPGRRASWRSPRRSRPRCAARRGSGSGSRRGSRRGRRRAPAGRHGRADADDRGRARRGRGVRVGAPAEAGARVAQDPDAAEHLDAPAERARVGAGGIAKVDASLERTSSAPAASDASAGLEPRSAPPARTRIGIGWTFMICSIASPPDIPGSSRSIVRRCGFGSSWPSRVIASSALAHTPTTWMSGSRASSRDSPVA